MFSFQCCMNWSYNFNLRRAGPGAVVKAALLGKSGFAGSNPSLAFTFQRNKMFFPCSLVKIEYCGEPL